MPLPCSLWKRRVATAAPMERPQGSFLKGAGRTPWLDVSNYAVQQCCGSRNQCDVNAWAERVMKLGTEAGRTGSNLLTFEGLVLLILAASWFAGFTSYYVCWLERKRS